MARFMKMSIEKLIPVKSILAAIFVTLMSINCGGSGVPETNFATCKDDPKPEITEIVDVDELEAIEAVNPTSSCERLRYQDDAKLLIDQASSESDETEASVLYLEAAVILEALVGFYPEDYPRYSLLAAAYAGAAGIELSSFLTQIGGGGNIFESGNETLPSPADANYESVKTNLAFALTWIDSKIESQVDATSKSDTLQASIYRMAQTMIIANGFLVQTADGEWDQEALENLSVEDVDAIIDNMATVAGQIDDPVLAEKLAAFSASDELTDDEKKELLKAELNK